MPWQNDLVGKTVIVLSNNVVGKVAKVYAAGEFLRDAAEPGELAVQKPVIQLETGHAFLADDAAQNVFMEMTPRDELVFESVQEAFKGAVGMAFRVAVAAQIQPEVAMCFIISGLEEALRALTLPAPAEAENADV